MNIKNKGYWNFLMELFFIRNVHPRRQHTLYLVRRLLPLKLVLFINSPIELINFALVACGFVTTVPWYQFFFQ
jgi:hypothetical protein